jgi:glycerol-3-phosphate O-acyltransferase
MALRFLYDVVVDEASLRRAHQALPSNAMVVYVMNHRSNADYVLVAYMLRHKIALLARRTAFATISCSKA